MAKKTKMRQDTQVLTQGFDPRLSVGSARPAVFRSSTYVFSTPEAAERAFDVASGRAEAAPDERLELIYSRINHPNAEIFEDQIVPLETGATGAVVFNSGMAAIMTALMANLQPGDAVVYTVPLYGGTQKLMEDFLPAWGVRTVPVVAGDRAAMDTAIRTTAGVKVVFVESPANPTLVMSDLRAASSAAWELGAQRPLLLVDNTFLGPVFQHPLALGADIVLYSATKYLGGFSDVIGGVALARDAAHLKPLARIPDSVRQHPASGRMLDSRQPPAHRQIAHEPPEQERPADRRVAPRPSGARAGVLPDALHGSRAATHLYRPVRLPGWHVVHRNQGRQAGGLRFSAAPEIGRNAVSLGGVETLVCHPKSTTHSGLSEAACRIAGITEGLVRLSIGIEDWRDLLADFEQALGAEIPPSH